FCVSIIMSSRHHRYLPSFPTRRSSDLCAPVAPVAPVSPFGPCAPVAPVAPVSPFSPCAPVAPVAPVSPFGPCAPAAPVAPVSPRSEEHTSELQSRFDLVCRLLLEKKKR